MLRACWLINLRERPLESSTSVQQPDQLFEEQSSAVSVGEQSTLEESFLLPRVYSSDEETDSDTESDFNETSAKEIYRDWMSSQCKSDVQMKSTKVQTLSTI